MAWFLVSVLFLLPSAAVATSAARMLLAPRRRWDAGSRWMVFVSQRRNETPPGRSELRFWASVWLTVAAAAAGTGILIALSG